MTELWESTFAEKQMMLGTEPSRSAVLARGYFARVGAKEILNPGIATAGTRSRFSSPGCP